MPDPQPDPWIENLKWLLCKMYEAWGGDCSELELDVASQIGELEEEYAANGPPSFDDAADAAEFQNRLTELEEHLALPQNTLSAHDTDRLTALIASLRPAAGN